MSEPARGPGPRRDAEANVDLSESGVLNTAARALIVGAALNDPSILDSELESVLAVGFEALPEPWNDWRERVALFEQSDRVLGRYGLLDEVRARENRRWLADRAPTVRNARTEMWPSVASGDQISAIAWLRLLMTDHEPIAASSAASVLASWDLPSEGSQQTSLLQARETARLYAEFGEGLAQEIAVAAIGDQGDDDLSDDVIVQPAGMKTVGPSLLVHGTAAWAGDWWYPGGDFHTYVRDHVRGDLYNGPHPFQWSGKYSDKHRQIAAKRLADWAGGDRNLNTVMAHSYGGVIALLATRHGLSMNELVLLSVPAENVGANWDRIGRIVSIRIHLDLVLLAARRRQRFGMPVAEHFLPFWFRSHSDSHDVSVWQAHDVSRGLGLTF